uniref:Cytochrome P450 n=1 Tax=Amblyomma maculatum TaxID=34609 RepID=G3MPA9_AMBMU
MTMAGVPVQWIVPFAITCLVVLLVTVLRWRRNKFSYFKKQGIPGPEPNLVSGHFHQIWSENALRIRDEWSRKYGDIYGFFNGDAPFLMVKDLELLRRVFVTDFGKFLNKGDVWAMLNENLLLRNSLTFARDNQWKLIRRLVLTTFRASKLRRMIPSVTETVDRFLGLLEKRCQETPSGEVDVCPMLAALAFDVAAETACGLRLDVQHKPGDQHYTSVRSMRAKLISGGFHKAGQYFSGIKPLVRLIGFLERQFGHEPLTELARKAKPIVELRAKDPSLSQPDLIQNFLEAKIPEELYRELEIKSRTNEKGDYRVPLTDIAANAATVLVAGFETVQVSSAHCLYSLAKHPNVQEKVREEVNASYNKHGGFTYDAITDLPYTTQVIFETLRLYSPAFSFTTRKASCDYHYKGIIIPQGTSIMACTGQIHMDPSLWNKPEEFNPDRFSPEQKSTWDPLAFQPYGMGPRNCAGIKLAQATMCLLLAKTVHRYRLHLGSQHENADLKLQTQAVLGCA